MRRCTDLQRILGDSLTVSIRRDLDDEGVWFADICATVADPDGVPYPADWMTYADSPEGALFMAWDLLSLVTGRCSVDHPEHDLSVETSFESDVEGHPPVPCWGCTRCPVRIPKDQVEEVPDVVL